MEKKEGMPKRDQPAYVKSSATTGSGECILHDYGHNISHGSQIRLILTQKSFESVIKKLHDDKLNRVA